jgi:hypothetical protein
VSIRIWRVVVTLTLSVTAALAVTMTPAAAASTSIWSSAAPPASADNDTSAVELGVRFRSDTNGFITGIRFYKFAGNTGTHVGNLWSSSGAWLQSATFTAETASGWQQVNFATPVAITANTIYIASYHTDVGHYAATSGYFASGVDNGPLHALADGVAGGNGVYRYGATALPNASWQGTNYWVDVVFTTTLGGADTTPPTIVSVTPAPDATGVSASQTITATFNEGMDYLAPSTSFELRDSAGNLVPASLFTGSGASPTATFTLTPTSPLAAGTSYTATIKGAPNGVKDLAGNPMAADFSWSFTTSAASPSPPAACPCSLWNASTPVGGMDGDTSAVELGVRFRSDQSGFITGLRFYKWSGNTGTHIGSLWTNAGARLATATFTGETASGWQQVTFAPAVAIAANTTYVASYHTDTGHYAASGDYFISPFDNAPLHALQDGVDGPSGVYRYGATGFPNQTYRSANYWVDVVFTTSGGGVPLTVTSVTPAPGATGVSTTTSVSASIVGFLSYPTVNTSTFELRDPAGTLLPATIGGGGETQTFTLSPTSPLAFSTTYTAKVKGGSTGIKDTSGNPMAADYTWTFITGAAPSPPPPVLCPCTIWNTASTAAAGPDPDTVAVELGVRFRSSTAGFITGVRFYKFSTNTGTHIGNLWSNTGALLATATFTAESSSGWQQVTFGTPVAIAANTTYVASYHTNTGHYAANGGYFVSSFDNPPLSALQDGTAGPNGVYRYGATSAFPTDTYNAANYWVDVVFVTNATLPADTTPPAIASTSPYAGNPAVAIVSFVTATFTESMDPATINGTTVELRDASGTLVPATVTYSVPNGTAILIPTNSLAYGTTYRATVKGGAVDPRAKDLAGNALAADYSWTFTTVPPPTSTCPCTLWTASTSPAVIEADASAVEVGFRFQSDTPGYITGLRFYKGLQNTGVHVGSLWTKNGVLLARATFLIESSTGWQQVSLQSPVAISANTTYVASYHTDTGHYAANSDYFVAPFDNAPLHALRDGVDGPSGVYMYSTSATFPSQTFRSANYWVDVVFNTVVPPDTTPPTVSSMTPAPGSTNVSITSVVTATFSEMMSSAAMNTSTLELRDSAGNLVPASVMAGGETPTATLTPTSPLAYATTYRVTAKGGANGVKDLAGNSMASDFSWLFTTASAPTVPTCPCSIWSDSTLPAGADADQNSISIGVKFRSSVAGYITALRLYKFPANGGTHVGELWTSTGTRLAVVTYASETGSGWQQVTLPSPVAIAANTTYVASYHADFGRYAVNSQYFAAAGVTNGPLRALANGEDGGNGVYQYGPPGTFPNQTFQGENYWADVVFAMSLPDTTLPMVTSVSPPIGTVAVPRNASVTATFSEAMNAATITTATFELRDPSGALVPASVGYNATTRTATLVPSALLDAATIYTAVVKGNAIDPTARDLAGNPLVANARWVFTTAATPSTTDGPGGPILIITSTSNPYSRYYAEILRAEGLSAFEVKDISAVTSSTLIAYNLVIIGEMPLTAAQATMFTSWANTGGNLIAMRPDKQLATLLGLRDLSSTLSDGYMRVDNSSPPGKGIVGETIQFHGTADVYALNGATSVAALYSGPLAATPNPAVTMKDATGANGGYSAAFTYDLARSIVYTRQGNPAWAGQDRDGFAPIRTNDLFFGASSTNGQADWIDLAKVAIPQADEQQRLLVNLILYMNWIRKPLPRFWYLPHGHKAAVVMTGEDHVNGNTAGRFDGFKAVSPADCSVGDWTCVRATSYVYPTTGLSAAAAAAYHADGFEIGVHVSTNCADWTPASLSSSYSDQLNTFASRFPGLPAPATHRMECSAWSDYASQPQVELTHGVRLDASYEYWPSSWVADRPGFFTGSGMPMRFVDATGALVDVYQSATTMTDESGQTYPATINTLLENALGPNGHYGVFTVAIHGDAASSATANAIVVSAQSRGVPVISARQMLEWLDGRNGSSFQSLAWSGTTLSFSVDVAPGANGLQVMLPTNILTATRRLTSITLNGNAVAFSRQTIKGIEYAIVTVAAGSYQATYAP